jgi:hypothetical protein
MDGSLMGNITLNGSTSGQITLAPTAVAGSNTITLPAATGTLLTTAGGQTISGTTNLSTLNITSGLTLSSAAGTSGQVLTSAGSGSAPTWSTPSAGAMTLISTLTASSSSSLSWTGLSTYDKYYLVFENLKPSAASQWLNLQIGYGATPTYLTSNYQTLGLDYLSGSSLHNISNDNGTFAFQFSGVYASVGATSGNGSSGFINITGTNSSSTIGFTSMSCYANDNPGFDYVSCSGLQTTNTSPITAIKIYFYSGNIVSGKASLYGISS